MKIDPRVRRTKALFENALLDLMEEKEYKAITVQEIAKRSTLNRATFYLHYYDKDDLLQQLLDDSLQELRERAKLVDIEYKYDSNQSHPIFIRVFDLLIEKKRFYQIMLAREKFPYFTDSVREIIESLVTDGTQYMIRDNIEYKVPVEISITYFASAYLGVITWWLKNDMPYSATFMAAQLTRMSTVGPYVKNPYLE